MTSYLIRRILLIIPTVFFALSFLFLLFFTLPGDPANLIAGGGDRTVDEGVLARVEERYGFNDPLYVQFTSYWERTVTWDLGESFRNGRSVNETLGDRAVNSLRLGVWAVIIEVIIGISVGIVSAIRRYSLSDRLTTIFTAAASAIPVFVLGFILQYAFAVYPNLHDWPEWARLRTSGLGPDTWTLFFIPTGEQWRYLILPALALASVSTALAARMTRGSMLEVMRADYMRTARAKGLSEREVVARHGLRNAMLPVVTLIGIDLGTVIGAAVLTETVFNWPGLGSGIAESVVDRDLPVTLGLTLVVVIAYSVVNLMVDVSYAWFDPDPAREGEIVTLTDGIGPSTELEVAEPGAADVADLAAARPMRKDVWRRFRRNKLAVVGMVMIILLVLVAVFAPLIAPYEIDERDPGNFRAAPSSEHWFGTDMIGQDVFSRVVYGARVSLRIGIIATAMSLIIGLALGATAGYFGRSLDTLIMRITDVFLAIPYIVLAVAIASVLGRSENAVILVLGLTGWLGICRIVRASFLSLRQLEYVEAARALGYGERRIMFRHILPNALQPIIVYGTIAVGAVILSEAALSFLGVGPQYPTPAWGLMVSEAGGSLSTAPHMMFFPGMAIFLTVLAFVFVGDGLRDALDPKLK